jgi:hypothetical protein
MEVETLVEWMLRRRGEMARNAEANGVVSNTMKHLKRKLQNVYLMGYGWFAYRQITLEPDSGENSNATCD